MKLEQELRKVEEIEYKSKLDPFTEYIETFIQRVPWYAVKQISKGGWKTKKKSLSDKPIKAHLNGQYYVGVLGKWYPGFTVFDIDDNGAGKADEIREDFKLDTNDSMLMTSETPGHRHLAVRPAYKSKPPTIRLLNEILIPHAKAHGVELYPQPNKPIRLPFGKGQKPVDIEYINLSNWKEYLYWFNKLDDFDIGTVPNQQLSLDLTIRPDNNIRQSTYQEGKYLYQTGLLTKHSRHDSQFKVLYYLFRNNIAPTNAIEMSWQWIKTKHNNYSTDILNSPHTVRKEIERQAYWLYEKSGYSQFYPDEVHNTYRGFITKTDIIEIFHITKASLPRARFLFNLIKYSYPRRYNFFIKLHSDRLREWSFRNYQMYLDELEKLGIVRRYESYKVGAFSKSIRVKWNFKNIDQVIMIDNRAPESIEETVRGSFEPREFRELLLGAGSKETVAKVTTSRLFNR